MSIILSTMPVMNGDWITQLIDEIDEIVHNSRATTTTSSSSPATSFSALEISKLNVNAIPFVPKKPVAKNTDNTNEKKSSLVKNTNEALQLLKTGIAAAHKANISYDFQINSTVNSILQPENMSAQWNSRRKTPSPRIKSPKRNEQSTSSSNNQKRSSPLVGRPLLDANLQATYGFPNHWCKISPEIFERRRRYRLEKLSHRNDDTLIDLS